MTQPNNPYFRSKHHLASWINRLLITILAAVLLSSKLAYSSEILSWPAPPNEARIKLIDIYTAYMPATKATGFKKLLQILLGATEISHRKQRLINPTGIFLKDNILYIADPGARLLMVYDETKKSVRWFPKKRTLKLISPVSVVVSDTGRVFVADSALRKVFIFNSLGEHLGYLENGPTPQSRPSGLAINKNHIYVADSMNHTISVYDINGIFIKTIGQRGENPGEFNYPTYLWFDNKNQELWVCDSGNFRIQWFSSSGAFLGTFGTGGDRPGFMARPRGVATDSQGHIYLVDGSFEAFQIFDRQGKLLLFVGHEGVNPGEFSLPGGIFIDQKDRILLADTHNARIQIFQYLEETKP